MVIDSTGTAAIIIFLATYAGMLLFYCGVVANILRNHDRRLEKLEDVSHTPPCVTAQLTLKELNT
jgi:NADH:ubiquinone oxidoreductase subunit 2 (subunit N)